MPGMGELFLILMILIVLPLVGVWVWMLVDCLTHETTERLVWTLVILIAGIIGALIYLIVRRPKRRALGA